MATADIRWVGVDQMLRNMTEYERKVHFAIKQVALYFAPVLENYAKQNAPWIDRTGNARQSLHAYVHELAGKVVRLYLSHGIFYGLWLEVKNQGKYAIIWPTIQAHLAGIKKMLDGIFR